MLIIWAVLFLHVVRAEPTYPDEADDPNDPGFPADPNDPTSPPYPPKEEDTPKKYTPYKRFDVPKYPDGLNDPKSDDDLKSDEDLNSDDDLNHQVIAPYPPKSRSSFANEYDQSNSDETNRYDAVRNKNYIRNEKAQTRRNKNYRVVVKQKLRIRKPKTVNVSRIVRTKVRRTRPIVHKVIRHYKKVKRPQKSKIHGFHKGGKDWKRKGGKLINLTLLDTDSDSNSEESSQTGEHSDSDETNETGESLERRFTNVYSQKSKVKYVPTYNKIELLKKGNKLKLNQENVDIAPVYQDSLNYDNSNHFKGSYPKNRQYYSKYQENYVHNNVGTVPKDKTPLVLSKFPSDNYQFSSSEEDSDYIGLQNGSPLQSQYGINTNIPIRYEEEIRTTYPKYSSGLEYLPKFTTYKETVREHRRPDYVITQLLHSITPQLNANEEELVKQAPYKENLRVNDIVKETVPKYDLTNYLYQDVKKLQDGEEASNSSEEQESGEIHHLWELNSTVKDYPAEVNEFSKRLEKVQQFLGQYKNNGGESLTEARSNTEIDVDSPKTWNSENSNQFQYLSSLRELSSNHEHNLDGGATSAKFYSVDHTRQNDDDNKNPPLRSPFHDKDEADDVPLDGKDNFSEVLVTKETNSLKQLPLDDNDNVLDQKLYIDTLENTPRHELLAGDLRQNDYNYTTNSISLKELPEQHSDDVADQIIYIDSPKITARDELSVVNTGENDRNNTKNSISLRELPSQHSNDVVDQIIDAPKNTDGDDNNRENDNYYTTDANDLITSVLRDEYGVLGIDNTESRAVDEGDNSTARQNEVNYTADLKTFRTLPVNHSDDVADQIYIENTDVSVIPLNSNDLRQEALRAAESYPANESRSLPYYHSGPDIVNPSAEFVTEDSVDDVKKLPQLRAEQNSEELISDLVEEALLPSVTNEAETYREEVEDVTYPLEQDRTTEQPDLYSQQLSDDTPEIFINEANLRQIYRQEQDYTTKGPVPMLYSLQQDYTTKGPVPYSLLQDYTTKGPVPYSLQQDYTTKGPVPYSLLQDYTTKGPVPYSLLQDYTTKGPVPYSLQQDYTTKGPVPYSLQQDYTTKGPVPYSLLQDYTTKGPVPYSLQQDYTTKGPVPYSLQQDYTTKGPVPYSLQQDYTTKGPVPYSLQQDYTTKGPVPYSLQQDYTTKGPVPYSLQQDYTTKQPVPLTFELDDKASPKETQMRQNLIPNNSNEVIAKKVPAGRSQYNPDYSDEDDNVGSEVSAKKDTSLTLTLDTDADSSSSDTREGTGRLRERKKLRSYSVPNWTHYFDDDVDDSASVEDSDTGETTGESDLDTDKITEESDQESDEMMGSKGVPFVLAFTHAQSLGGLHRLPNYEDHTTTIGRLCRLAKNNLLRLRILVATAYGLNTDTADEKDLITIVYILGKLNEARATKRPVEKLVDDFLVNLQRLAVLRKLLCKNFDNEHTYDEITNEGVTNEINYVDILREYLEKTGQNITSYYERYYPNNGKATEKDDKGKSKDSVRFGQDRWQVNPVDKEVEQTELLSKTTERPTTVASLDMLNQLLNKYKITTHPPPTKVPPYVHTTPSVAHVVTEIPSYLDTTVTLPNSPTNDDYNNEQQIGNTDGYYDTGVITEESLVEHTTHVPIDIWLPTLPTYVDQNDNNSPVQDTDDYNNHQPGQYPDNHQHHVDQNKQHDNEHTTPSEDYYHPNTELNPTTPDHSVEYDELIDEFKKFMEQHPPKTQEVTRPGYAEWELNPGKKFKHFDISLDGKKMIFKLGGKENEHHHRISIEGILHKIDIENIMKVANFESVDQTPVDEELRTLFEQRDRANEAIFTEYLWLNVQKLRAAHVDEHKINYYVHFITTKVYPALFRALKGCQDLKVKIAKAKLKLYMPKI